MKINLFFLLKVLSLLMPTVDSESQRSIFLGNENLPATFLVSQWSAFDEVDSIIQ